MPFNIDRVRIQVSHTHTHTDTSPKHDQGGQFQISFADIQFQMPNQFSQPHNVDTKFTVCFRENRERESKHASYARPQQQQWRIPETRQSHAHQVVARSKQNKKGENTDKHTNKTSNPKPKNIESCSKPNKKGKISKQEVNGKGALVRERKGHDDE